MSGEKNYYGENVQWFCLDAAITLQDQKEEGAYVIDDEVEIYGEDASGNEGSVSVCVISLLESAHVVIGDKYKEIAQLKKDKEDLVAVLSSAISGWDYEEVAHHCGVDAETASRVIKLLNKEGKE